MSSRQRTRFGIAALVLVVVSSPHAAATVSSRSADVAGVTLHYLTAGTGPAVILLHGYTQTSRMWQRRRRRRGFAATRCGPISSSTSPRWKRSA